MTEVHLFAPHIPTLLGRLKHPQAYFYLLSGLFWIAGLFHPYAGLLFYISLVYPVSQLYFARPDPSDLFYFLLPYFLTVGLGVWHTVFPFGLGILLALLLCDLVSKLLARFLAPAAGGISIILFPGALALMDAFFQRVPRLTAMEMIPVLSPIYHHTPMLASAAWLGRHITYLTVLSGTTAILLLVYFSVASPDGISFTAKRATALLAFVCSATVTFAHFGYPPPAPHAPTVTVTAVQASLGYHGDGTSLTGEDAFAYRFQRYVAAAGVPAADIVLFPEIMVGIYDTEGAVDQAYREVFSRQAGEWNALLVPLVLEGSSRTQSREDRRITSLVVDESGILGQSSKRNLVPFSETREFRPGRDYQPVSTPLGRIGLSICFDANGPTIRRLAANRAQIILAPFNNTGFTHVFHTVHRFYTIIQAVEYQMPVVVANESGISQIIDRTGRIVTDLAIGQRGTIQAAVPLSTGPSPYLKYGWIWEGTALLAIVLIRQFYQRRG